MGADCCGGPTGTPSGPTSVGDLDNLPFKFIGMACGGTVLTLAVLVEVAPHLLPYAIMTALLAAGTSYFLLIKGPPSNGHSHGPPANPLPEEEEETPADVPTKDIKKLADAADAADDAADDDATTAKKTAKGPLDPKLQAMLEWVGGGKLLTRWLAQSPLTKDEWAAVVASCEDNDDDDGCQYILGFLSFVGEAGRQKDAMMAMQYWKKGAAQGNAAAQLGLGNLFCNGESFAEDFDAAFRWFKQAADQGNPIALFSVGNCFRHGKGVGLDFKEALRLFTLSAEGGFGGAMCTLGDLYVRGTGVDQNIEEGKKWFQKAADQGMQQGIKALAEIKKAQTEGPSKEVLMRLHTMAAVGNAQAITALAQLQTAADKGDARAKTALVEGKAAYEEMIKDPKKAAQAQADATKPPKGQKQVTMTQLIAAAQQGNKEAQTTLERLKQAAKNGDPQARSLFEQFRLQQLKLANAQMIPEAMAEMARIKQQAADGHAGAKTALEVLDKMPVPVDPRLAQLKMAIAQGDERAKAAFEDMKAAAEGGDEQAAASVAMLAQLPTPPQQQQITLQQLKALADDGDPNAKRALGQFKAAVMRDDANALGAVKALKTSAKNGDQAARDILAFLWTTAVADM